jgi:hypothetical protein
MEKRMTSRGAKFGVVAFGAVVVGGLFVACSGADTPDPANDASSAEAGAADARRDTAVPYDPICEQSGDGCLIYECECANGKKEPAPGGDVRGNCYSAEVACKPICEFFNSTVASGTTCRKRDAGGPKAPPPPGQPGSACTPTTACIVGRCICNDGSGVLLVPAPCKNGICGSSKDVCASACEDKGGWSGRADENW